jgi:hypothetical protein
MDCREFREKHVGFVDDVLPAIDMEVMHRHLRSCPRCTRHDVAVRRGLMLVRNIPQIELSTDFMLRLNERIATLNPRRDEIDDQVPYRLTSGAFAALAAGLTLFAYAALEAVSRFSAPQALTMPPVVATAPARPVPSLTNSAYMAGISMGMPVWPAVLMADEAPQRLADVQLQQASLR